MTRRRTRITAAAGCMVLIAIVAYQIQAQKPPSAPRAQRGSFSNRNSSVEGMEVPAQTAGMSRPSARAVIAKKTADSIKKYKAAKSAEDRAAAEKELRAALVEKFELLMKQREAHLADLKTRLERLTAQLQKRRDAKGEIVDLRLKVLINEANGLGFFPDSNQPGGFGGGGEGGRSFGGVGGGFF